ncbi:MAG TPA: amino acid permease [Vicinamibacterales bacterium]|nr:amino acid permease [Vicinamibacterales bacterium]
MTSASTSPGLVRAIGRWSLTGLAINTIIGSGIFGLPDDIARRVGSAAPFAYLIAAVGIGIVMACFAEVASQLPQSGGPYLYARVAFGRLAAIEMGWLAWLVRVTAAAANANLFVAALGLFFPQSSQPLIRAALLATLAGVLGVVNIRGVKSGTKMSDIVAISKLVPLAFFIVSGLALVGSQIHVGASDAPSGEWLQAILALVFAYGGFEAALMPMGEAKDARRDAPFALFMALGIVVVTYLLVHLVVMGAFPDPAAFARPEVRERPLAEAARVFLGQGGAVLITIGMLISTYGNLAGSFIASPRLTFAFAEQGDFPQFLAAVHPRFRTPYISILIHVVAVGGLAIVGSFIFNAILSSAARLFQYALVCAAVPMMRHRAPDAPAFRLPGGPTVPALGLLFCVVIAMYMDRSQMGIIAFVVLAAALHWLVARYRRPGAVATRPA